MSFWGPKPSTISPSTHQSPTEPLSGTSCLLRAGLECFQRFQEWCIWLFKISQASFKGVWQAILGFHEALSPILQKKPYIIECLFTVFSVDIFDPVNSV